MSKLSKQEKMAMISKAIDAGFNIEVSFHNVESMEEMNEKLALFPNLPVKFRGHEKNQDAWAKLNRDFPYEDRFEATIFFK